MVLYVKDLNPTLRNPEVAVKILREWPPHFIQGQPFYQSLILVDERGNRIDAKIDVDLYVSRYYEKIKEGDWCEITGFLVIEGQQSFRNSNHLFQILIHDKTKMIPTCPRSTDNFILCYETLDRSLRDIMKCDQIFGGKVIVLGGDFRQILPVITEGGRVATILASINSSVLWNSCKVLKLTENLRLRKASNSMDAGALAIFSKWLLDIGDGKINETNSGDVEIEIPNDLLINTSGNPIEAIVKEIYGERFATRTDPKFFSERAILSPRNDNVDKTNQFMFTKLPGEERRYLSSDSIETSDTSGHDDMIYTQEFLNNIQVSGLPSHVLTLKIGAHVMLLRNIYPKGGLCNGTRLIITQMANHVIETRIVTGKNVGDRVLIPRIYVSPPHAKFPFRMRRRQFPVTVAFAITINKSQCQTLEHVGLFLPKPVFTHGQLYVAFSRVTTRKGLKVLVTDKDGKCQNKTLNVVYKEIFETV